MEVSAMSITKKPSNAGFLCICMSPAIDATVVLPFAPKGKGEIFKDVAEEENVGGKTVNVARWLAIRGAKVVCGGLLGEDNDGPFVRELAKYSIADGFVRVPGATRRNEMVTWPGGSVKLNRAAFPGLGDGVSGAGCAVDTVEALMDGVLSLRNFSSLTTGGRVVAILSGSLPPAIPKGFYAMAIAAFKAQGWLTVLASSGEAMRLALEAGPDLIKPNADECEPLVGFVPRTAGEFLRATGVLRRKAAHVIISDGEAGAWFDGEFVAAPGVDAVDSTAAGDTLLAEYCWRAFGVCESPAEAARWAVAAGSAACTMPGGAPPPVEKVESLSEKVFAEGDGDCF